MMPIKDKQARCEAAIRSWLQEQYTDERLAALLAHAEDGKLVYNSCDCLVGAANADHALGRSNVAIGLHYHGAKELPCATAAENAFYDSGFEAWGDGDSLIGEDALRRGRLIPLIRAEMQRRESLRRIEDMVAEAVCV